MVSEVNEKQDKWWEKTTELKGGLLTPWWSLMERIRNKNESPQLFSSEVDSSALRQFPHCHLVFTAPFLSHIPLSLKTAVVWNDSWIPDLSSNSSLSKAVKKAVTQMLHCWAEFSYINKQTRASKTELAHDGPPYSGGLRRPWRCQRGSGGLHSRSRRDSNAPNALSRLHALGYGKQPNVLVAQGRTVIGFI